VNLAVWLATDTESVVCESRVALNKAVVSMGWVFLHPGLAFLLIDNGMRLATKPALE